ncbi:hypothetical protein B0X78_13425, partial [bacterium AM6]
MQPVQLLLAAIGLQAQARHLQRPAFCRPLPTQARLQPLQLNLRARHARHRRAFDTQITQVRIGDQRHRGEITQRQPQVELALTLAQAHAAGRQQRRPGTEIDRIGAYPGLAVAALAIQVQHRRQRQGVGLCPRTHAHPQAVAIHAQAQVDTWQGGIEPQRWRMHAEAATNHLQFAQPAQRIQRIAASAGLRQAAHRPAAIGGLLQVQRQAAQAH